MKTKNLLYKKKNFFKTRINIGNNILSIKNFNICLFIIIFLLATFLPMSNVKAANTYKQKVTNGIESFPENYKKLLEEFVEETNYVNWNFQAYYTGIDWNDFVKAEAEHGKNRVHKSFDTAYRCSCGNLESGYYCANSQITAYFMDPRNFINERNIFQFLDISYNEKIYTKEMLEKFISNYEVFNKGKSITFVMSDENHEKYEQEVTMTFTDIIMEAAKKSQMSPISMAIKIVQEVGTDGSASTDGNNSTYPNTYNYFNIGASDSGDAILNGLKYANDHGWHCPYTAIVEGAEFNSSNYIKAGQNTAYFYKFDCVGNKILNIGETQTINDSDLLHQYMTNIQDPYTQSATLFSVLTQDDFKVLLNESLNFIIPVYDNMPELPISKISSLSNSDKDLYYADISSSLVIRDKPYGNVIKTIYKDDLVIMLQRNYNSEWDKIQLWDGQIGYTMTEYLEPFNNNTGTGGETPPAEENFDPIPNIGYGYANVSSSLNVRKGPGTSYGIVDSLLSKEEFLILEESDNWSKIRLEDGTIGYVSKEYVEKIEYIKVDENNKIITVIPNITANIVAGKLNGKEFTVKKADTEIKDNTLGTNYIIKIDDKEYTIIKLGDVNGDSKVNTLDALVALKYDVNIVSLDEIYLKAFDVNKDGENNTKDALDLLKYDVELKSINL